MPLPATTERAARAVARVLTDLDETVARYLQDRALLPGWRDVIDELRPLVRSAVTAAFTDIDPDVTQQQVETEVNAQLTSLQRAIRGTLGQAERLRARMPRVPPVQEDDETIAGFVARVGKHAAFGALIAGTVDAARVARRVGGVRTPARTAGYGRMVVRTETAIARNNVAADLVDDRVRAAGSRSSRPRPGDWVVYVRDGMKGPTDRECEDVDGRYATATWLRRHPVEHPHCTREGRPRRLPAGESVTLLA